MLHQCLSFDYFILHFTALRLNSTSSIYSFCLNTFINTHDSTDFHVVVVVFLSLCLFVAFSYMFVGFCLAYSGSFFNFILWAGVGRVLNKYCLIGRVLSNR